MSANPAELAVIDQPDQAAALLQPLRLRLVESLAEPDSAAGLARRLGLRRQKINYHLRELEQAGFVKLVEERRKGNCVERLVQATARAYVISPATLGRLGSSPTEARDRFSSAYLIATAAGLIRDVAVLRERAAQVGKELATLTLQSDVRFATPFDQAAFAQDLAAAFARIAAKYHDDDAPRGRLFRFTLAGHPAVTKTEEDVRREAEEHASNRPDPENRDV